MKSDRYGLLSKSYLDFWEDSIFNLRRSFSVIARRAITIQPMLPPLGSFFFLDWKETKKALPLTSNNYGLLKSV